MPLSRLIGLLAAKQIEPALCCDCKLCLISRGLSMCALRVMRIVIDKMIYIERTQIINVPTECYSNLTCLYCTDIISQISQYDGGKMMEAYFAFTDECGNYQKIRSEKFNRAHPFYVRSTVIMSFSDYLVLQKGMDTIKVSFNVQPDVEIKWAHFGSALKGNYNKIPHRLTPEQLKDYYAQALCLLISLKSATVYYTLTDNNVIRQVDETALLKMHLQNAYQRVQSTVSEKDGFAIVVADDLNDKTKALKEAVYAMTLTGDYVQYSHIKKGLYIDFSNQCHGLQIADICAGVFTASAKYESVSEDEKHKYECGHELFFNYAYKKTRNSFYHAPYYEVYKYGVKEVPNGAGDTVAKAIATSIENSLFTDLMREFQEMCKE